MMSNFSASLANVNDVPSISADSHFQGWKTNIPIHQVAIDFPHVKAHT